MWIRIINASYKDYWIKTKQQQNGKLNEIALKNSICIKAIQEEALMKVEIKDLFLWISFVLFDAILF